MKAHVTGPLPIPPLPLGDYGNFIGGVEAQLRKAFMISPDQLAPEPEPVAVDRDLEAKLKAQERRRDKGAGRLADAWSGGWADRILREKRDPDKPARYENLNPAPASTEPSRQVKRTAQRALGDRADSVRRVRKQVAKRKRGAP